MSFDCPCINSFIDNDEYCCLAARSGHLDCLIKYHKAGYELTNWVFIYAIKFNNYDCLEYALKNIQNQHLEVITGGFVPNIRVLKLLCKYKYEISYHRFIEFIYFDKLKCVKYTIKKNKYKKREFDKLFYDKYKNFHNTDPINCFKYLDKIFKIEFKILAKILFTNSFRVIKYVFRKYKLELKNILINKYNNNIDFYIQDLSDSLRYIRIYDLIRYDGPSYFYLQFYRLRSFDMNFYYEI